MAYLNRIKRNEKGKIGFLPVNNSAEQPCYECGELTKGKHHVVPVVRGGTKVIPLCHSCHTKVHGYVSFSDCIKEGLRKAKESGTRLGARLKLTEDIVNKIIDLSSTGMTQREIAKEMGLSVGSVNRALRL